MVGTTAFFLGELAPARAHLEHVMTLYDPQQHRSFALLYGQDPMVNSLSVAAWTLWMLGYPDQASQSTQRARILAQELSHPYSLGSALGFAAMLAQCRREAHATQEHADAMVALAAEQGFVQWLAMSTVCRGWALAAQGRREDGAAQMRQGLAMWRATGAELVRPFQLAMLAEVYGTHGHTAEGLTVLAEALAAVEKTGERFYEAELHRLQGELLLQQVNPDEDQAETCFHQALAIASHQQAKSLELRAAMSLARLWQQQGARAEASALLAPVYGWFTEGFDTADLQEATALLEVVSR
jgi:predicted ATPase